MDTTLMNDRGTKHGWKEEEKQERRQSVGLERSLLLCDAVKHLIHRVWGGLEEGNWASLDLELESLIYFHHFLFPTLSHLKRQVFLGLCDVVN